MFHTVVTNEMDCVSKSGTVLLGDRGGIWKLGTLYQMRNVESAEIVKFTPTFSEGVPCDRCHMERAGFFVFEHRFSNYVAK